MDGCTQSISCEKRIWSETSEILHQILLTASWDLDQFASHNQSKHKACLDMFPVRQLPNKLWVNARERFWYLRGAIWFLSHTSSTPAGYAASQWSQNWIYAFDVPILACDPSRNTSNPSRPLRVLKLSRTDLKTSAEVDGEWTKFPWPLLEMTLQYDWNLEQTSFWHDARIYDGLLSKGASESSASILGSACK